MGASEKALGGGRGAQTAPPQLVASCPRQEHRPWFQITFGDSSPSIFLLSLRINLRTLQRVAVVHVDGFPLRIEIESGCGGFAMAVSGLFGSSEGQVSLRSDGWGIHVENAGFHLAHCREGIVHVAGVDRKSTRLNSSH